jgi:imidazolonepropionase-like amidohydrolase
MATTLLTNARVFDGTNADCPEGMNVLIEDGTIREISSKPIKATDPRVIDVGGHTLMPGLIDNHIHAYASDVNVQKIDLAGDPYRTAHAVRMLGHASTAASPRFVTSAVEITACGARSRTS